MALIFKSSLSLVPPSHGQSWTELTWFGSGLSERSGCKQISDRFGHIRVVRNTDYLATLRRKFTVAVSSFDGIHAFSVRRISLMGTSEAMKSASWLEPFSTPQKAFSCCCIYP